MTQLFKQLTVNGDTVWFQDGLLHRLDGPAIEFTDGSKRWYQNDLLHRLDGPAIEHANGDKSWWYKDFVISTFQGLLEE